MSTQQDVLDRMLSERNCARCQVALVGDPSIHKVDIKVGAGFRWSLNMCWECRHWLQECVRRSMVVDEKPEPEQDGPRQITL
jgi:hypothetical protein